MDFTSLVHGSRFAWPMRLLAVLAAALAGCAGPAPVPASGGVQPEDAWVELGPVAVARAVVAAGAGCPTLDVDGHPQPMTLRVAAGTAARRPTANDPGGPSKAFAFPVDVCESAIAPGTRDIRLGGRALPAPAAAPRRIVVLGDTGCRLKGALAQDCNRPERWPFAEVARVAASLKPDLVVHVGDYHYRETPCPADVPGCTGSPWGYGWDVWHADFLEPARPLLAQAPWVFVRGNHESCRRAGQGWFRLLAPEPYAPTRSCDLAANDDDADFTPPYAVPLGADAQLVVFDSSAASFYPFEPGKPRDDVALATYGAEFRAVTALAARPGVRSFFASHHPLLAFTADLSPGATTVLPGTASLLPIARSVNGGAYLPPGTQLALHGHVHLFQALGFDDGHPAALVAGNGGDLLDPRLPWPLPPGTTPAPGVRLAQASTSDAFGFLVLERADTPPGTWIATARRRDGSVLTRCTIAPDGALACTPSGDLH
jgi:hypothetical protein